MIKILLPVLLLFLFGCGTKTSNKLNAPWKTIEIGNYLFDFPPDFKLAEEQGIDSYVGTIKGDSMWFSFDFGYYSNDFGQTAQEYLEKGHWRHLLSLQFAKEGITYYSSNLPRVDILNIRPATSQDSIIGKGCDYIAACRHEDSLFEYAVYLPQEIKHLNFMIDSTDNQYRKIVYAKDPQIGITGIFIRDLKSFSKSINSYLALSMATSKLTKQQQVIALKIFRTGRNKN